MWELRRSFEFVIIVQTIQNFEDGKWYTWKIRGKVKFVMDLLEGPFKTLNGTWKFIPLGDDACKIEFRLQYDFAGSILSALISPVFSHLSGALVDAFIKEADRRYGQN